MPARNGWFAGECDFSPGSQHGGSVPSPRRDEMSKLGVFDLMRFTPPMTCRTSCALYKKEYLIGVEDACVVERGADGKPDIKPLT